MRLASPALEVSFSEDVLRIFSKNRQNTFWKAEAGGQLFAHIAGQRWEVVKATGPRRSDYRKRFIFFPSRKDDQEEINEAFRDGLHYVGDWHTHPERKPTPSSLDLESMASMVRSSEYQLPGFLMVIVGTNNIENGLWTSFHCRDGTFQRFVLI